MKSIIRYFISLIFIVTNVINGTAQNVVRGQVTKVSDGDTFTMEICEGTSLMKERIRLQGIDAPEGKGNQPYWQQSRNYLAKLIDKKEVTVTYSSRDRYGRILGTVKVEGVEDVNLEMLKKGLAWHYSYYDHTVQYAEAEEQAKANKIGLWADEAPVSPYQWRQEHKKVKQQEQ